MPTLDSFGSAPALRLHDSSSGTVVATAPQGTGRLYVCGITPYDATHLGHAATYVAFDLLNRAWRDAGHDVRYVQNVTDVDRTAGPALMSPGPSPTHRSRPGSGRCRPRWASR